MVNTCSAERVQGWLGDVVAIGKEGRGGCTGSGASSCHAQAQRPVQEASHEMCR